MKGKTTVTVTYTKDENGVVSIAHNTEGDNMHFYEIIGLLEIVQQDLITASHERADKLNKKPKEA